MIFLETKNSNNMNQDKETKISISIISPSYNKGKTIKRLYESLVRQTNYDFEWIIINDGSTDNTTEIIKSFKMDLFPIRFFDKENEGLNRTYNRGVKLAQGEYILRVDPDDYLTEDAIEQFLKYKPQIDADETLCGMAFLTKYSNGNIVGYHPFKDVKRTNFADYRLIYNGKGDRTEPIKTKIGLQYLMPEIEGEKFCREYPMWYGIAEKYDALYIPYPIYIREYSENSISANPVKNLSKNPKGTMIGYMKTLHILEDRRKKGYNVTKEILRTSVNLYRFGLYAKKELKENLKTIPFRIKIMSFVPGIVFHYIDILFPNLINNIIRFIRKRELINI